MSLKHLSLKSKTPQEIMALMAEITPDINTISFSFEALQHRTSEDLANIFRMLPAWITTLDLSDNRLSEKPLEELTIALSAIPSTVERVDMSYNSMDCFSKSQLIYLSRTTSLSTHIQFNLESFQATEQQLRAFKATLQTFTQHVDDIESEPTWYQAGCNLSQQLIITPVTTDLQLEKIIILTQKSIHVITNRDDQQAAHDLAKCAQTVQGSTSSAWRTLGLVLLGFAVTTLILAAILSSIPSGGTTVLLSIASAAALSVGISTNTGICIGSSVIVTTALTGLGLFAYKNNQGLAKAACELAATQPKTIQALPEDQTPLLTV